MNHGIWVAWLAMLAGIVVNGVASLVARPAMWVTLPLALLLVLHYYRVIRAARRA